MNRLKFFWPYLTNKNPKFNKNEDTPFHFVAYNGISDVADFMMGELHSVKDLLPENKEGITPLHYMSRGHVEIIRSLRRKIDFELIKPTMFEDILQKAIEYGSLECLKALLEKQTSYFQRSCVWIARNYYSYTMYEGHHKIAQYLSKEFGLSTYEPKRNIGVGNIRGNLHMIKSNRKTLG